MKKRVLLIVLLILALLLAGCQNENIPPLVPDGTRPPDIEPTATYDWMAGESPVPNRRIGLTRVGVNLFYHAVSPKGVYFMQEAQDPKDSYIWYTDHGSDQMIKLCGRADCNHNNEDCNAYVFGGSLISYYGGYLYAIWGNMSEDDCKLIRMEPDGSNHVTVLDFVEFAKENGGDFVQCEKITEGYLLFQTLAWKTVTNGSSQTTSAETVDYYLYKLDGSKGAPKEKTTRGMLYNCGDMVLSFDVDPESETGYSLWSTDLDTDTATFLTHHPGVPGYYDEEQGYYFRDGAICRLTYSTQEEEILVDTGLEEDYFLFVFPDCMVLARSGFEGGDQNLYIYNWAFELVDTVATGLGGNTGLQFSLIAETAERFILTTTYLGMPKYYINKAELGTGDVKLHKFNYT